MSDKRKRSQNFTLEEKEKLVKLLVDQKATILNKKTDGATNEAKLSAWIDITNRFNESASIYRSKESLMKVWEKLKSESKLYHSSTKKLQENGGGLVVVKSDPVLELVCNVMGLGCTGFLHDNSQINTKEESFPKVVCVEVDIEPQKLLQDPIKTEPIFSPEKNIVSEEKLKNTPMWSRRRRVLNKKNERKAIDRLCLSYDDANKRKKAVEDLKYILLKEEYETQKKLNKLKILSATKDVEIRDLDIEIKKMVLKHLTDGILHNVNIQ